MHYSAEEAAKILGLVQKVMNLPEPADVRLHRLWMTITDIRTMFINEALRTQLNGKVFAGPFKGMSLTPETLTGRFSPHLLGCYEHELHGVVERVIASPYQLIINVGCSFGYYAVGLALRMPQTIIDAFDIDEAGQMACRRLAVLNNVGERVKVSGLFQPSDFEKYKDRPTLALVDIEGAELELLEPVRYPALQSMDLIVELHDCYHPSISTTIRERFAATHTIEFIENRSSSFPLEDVFGTQPWLDHLDGALASRENRSGPTPWVFMRAKNSVCR